MKKAEVKTQSATYAVHVNEVDERAPYSILLHGGPGFNNHAERAILGPKLHPHLNFLWFDLLGCGESPAHSPDRILWDNQIADIAEVVRHFTDEPINVLGHCLGAPLTHDLMRRAPGLIRRAIWVSPVRDVAGLLKGVLTRSLLERRLDPDRLSDDDRRGLVRFISTTSDLLIERDVLQLLSLIPKIDGFHELYWSNAGALQAYLELTASHPLVAEVFVRLQTEYFARGTRAIPDYEGIPVLVLYSDDDQVTPWDLHGKRILEGIPGAQARMIPGAAHWIHLQAPDAFASCVLEFLA